LTLDSTCQNHCAAVLANGWNHHDMAPSAGAIRHRAKLSVGNQTRNNRILLENYYVPGDLEAQIDAFVADYNHRRYGRRLL
jgi:putative transposase